MTGIKEMKRRTYEQSHKMIGDELYKLCSLHEEYFPNEDEWLPCTEEYFYKTNSKNTKGDGLFPYCKECNKRKFKKWINDNEEHFKTYVKERDANLSEKRIMQKRKISKEQRLTGYHSEYRRKNKSKVNFYTKKRQHKNHEISINEWEKCKEYFNNSCAYCGISNEEAKEKYNNYLHKEHVDHEGANDLSNCVPACKSCNSEKWEFKFEDWYNKNNVVFDINRFNKIINWLDKDYKKYIDRTN